MKNTSYYIDEIKRAQGITSDYAVAKLLGVQCNMMSHYKNGRSSFDGDMVFRVAELSGHNPLEIIANIKAEKSNNPALAKQWHRLANQVSSMALAIILSVLTVVTLPANTDGARFLAEWVGGTL